MLSFSTFWLKTRRRFHIQGQHAQQTFLFKMPSFMLTEIWAFISVISSMTTLAEIIWCLNYLGFALCTDLLLLISSCQTSVNFCIESCPAVLICLRNPQNMTENQSTASMNRENKLCRKFKVHLTHRLQCHFSSGSIFLCFCFTIFLWYFCFSLKLTVRDTM